MARRWIKVAQSQSGQTVSSQLARRTGRRRRLDQAHTKAGLRVGFGKVFATDQTRMSMNSTRIIVPRKAAMSRSTWRLLGGTCGATAASRCGKSPSQSGRTLRIARCCRYPHAISDALRASCAVSFEKLGLTPCSSRNPCSSHTYIKSSQVTSFSGISSRLWPLTLKALDPIEIRPAHQFLARLEPTKSRLDGRFAPNSRDNRTLGNQRRFAFQGVRPSHAAHSPGRKGGRFPTVPCAAGRVTRRSAGVNFHQSRS